MKELFYQYSFYFLYFAIALVVIALIVLLVKILLLMKTIKKMQPKINRMVKNANITNVKITSIQTKISGDLVKLKQVITYATIGKLAYDIFVDEDKKSAGIAAKSITKAINQNKVNKFLNKNI